MDHNGQSLAGVSMKVRPRHDFTYYLWLEDLQWIEEWWNPDNLTCFMDINPKTQDLLDILWKRLPLKIWEVLVLRGRWSGRYRHAASKKNQIKPNF